MWKPAPLNKSSVGTTISRDQVRALEHELDMGESMQALKRFNEALKALPEDYTTVSAEEKGKERERGAHPHNTLVYSSVACLLAAAAVFG